MTITPDKLRKDAERYRFIRTRIGYDLHGAWIPGGNTKVDGNKTDAAIDAAMKEEKE